MDVGKAPRNGGSGVAKEDEPLLAGEEEGGHEERKAPGAKAAVSAKGERKEEAARELRSRLRPMRPEEGAGPRCPG